MNSNNSITFNNGGDASVNITQTDTGGEILLALIKAVFGLIAFVIASPILVPLMISESRKSKAISSD